MKKEKKTKKEFAGKLVNIMWLLTGQLKLSLYYSPN